MAQDDVSTWQDQLEADLASVSCVRRVLVLRETSSTQDAAWHACAGGTPTLVVADRQSSGRGRLGRSWVQGESGQSGGLGVAATFGFPGLRLEPEALSLGAGLAAWEACESCLPATLRSTLGLRWPNDVVERAGRGRKIAGVLIEARDGVVLVGIGINVLHRDEDFPEMLRGRAASLAMLGVTVPRLRVIRNLLGAVDRARASDAESLAERWRALDTLVGTRRTFEHAGRRVVGTVLNVAPTSHIEVRSDDGVVHRLESLHTSMVHDAT